MPPPVILDPATLDLTRLIADRAAIERVNPQRGEFELIDGIVYCDEETRIFAGYHDVRSDAWWTRGHIPGRPLFPGVLMIEAAAQLAGYLYKSMFPEIKFIGFAGVDKVKFRGTVEPPCRLVLIGRSTQLKARRTISQVQGFVGSTMVFEGEITGMPV